MNALKGLVQVYTGDGKGKTTAALGLALRAAGRGLRVLIVQFMKPPESTGEQFALPELGGRVEIRALGQPKWLRADRPDPEDVRLAEKGLAEARQAMLSGALDLLILDEVNVAVHFHLLRVEDVLGLLRDRPENVEVVLTGRRAAPELIEAADLVTEMRLIKHPFEQGVKAREGIEF
jgi:cob(I)alamin adenosyltransferase